MRSVSNDHILTLDTINPRVLQLVYATRGPITLRALELEKELASGVKKPFSKIIKTYLGDCHASGQKPITFIRQVLAICCYPALLKNPDFPQDVRNRAHRILECCNGYSIGAYSHSTGLSVVRLDISRYIHERDGFPSDPDDIILTSGTTDGIHSVVRFLMSGNEESSSKTGIMVPVPQYSIYTSILLDLGARPIEYFLKEDKEWCVDVKELERSVTEAKDYCTPRAIVVINPGNPTGHVMTEESVRELMEFAYKERLFVIADEIYQDTVYSPRRQFYSFKKVANAMGYPYSRMEMASFMSVSKGYIGECGMRGGCMEVVNLLPEVKKQLQKSVTGKLCPPVPGQVVMDCVVNPPIPGDPSYELFQSEKQGILGKFREKAAMVLSFINTIDGMHCNEIEGAFYAFPRLILPEKAVKAATAAGQSPDVFYCFDLLETSGICAMPGSNLGQAPGTYHFRLTILQSVDALREALSILKVFHSNFMAKYA